MPTEQRHREILEVIRGIAGDGTIEPVKVLEHEWAKDPFSRAAYTDAARITGIEHIYEPVKDALFWAGVITDQVDFSYASGRQTAMQLLDRMPKYEI